MSAARCTLAYDPLDLEPDPYPVYRRLRDEAPVYSGDSAAGPFRALSRFDDIQAAARDWRTFSSRYGNDLDDTGSLFGPSPAMDLADPPTHRRQRDALRRAFAPRTLNARLEPLVRTKVRELLDRLAQHDSVDFARDLAYPLPAALIFGWLGFPRADHAQLRRWHLAMLQRTPGVAQLPARAVQARDAMWGHIEQALDDRHARRRDDLLSALADAEADGALSRGEAMANALFFLDAGIVSTSALISSALLHLQRRPAQRELLRRSAQIIPAAVEELLRFDAPFQWFTRVTTRAVDVRGRRIEAGERVVLIWASANRDERRWEHADELLLTRDPQRHLSFSEGIHHCLGSHLARMEARILLEELMPRLVDYDIAGPVRRRITPSERTISSLPVHVRWSRGG